MTLRRYLPLASLLTLTIAGAQAVPMETVSEPLRSDASATQTAPTWRAPALRKHAGAELRMQTLADERVHALRRHNAQTGGKLLQIGIARDIASEAAVSAQMTLDWQPVAGGLAARLDVVAPGAKGLRIALRPQHWPAGVELRVGGSDMTGTVYTVAAEQAKTLLDGDGRYWTAVTDGDSQRLELFAPNGVEVAAVQPNIEAVSHLLVAMHTQTNLLKALGDSGTCNIDVVCRVGTLGQAFVSTKNAVARMAFQVSGGTATCTGTLLNDLDNGTQIPWFYSANHCISAQATANTLTTFWNYETPTCGVNNAGPNIQLASGAQLLYAQASTDGALLRLNGTPPAGAVLAGWNAGPMTPSTAVIAIHHPSGDIKKYSRGNHSGAQNNVNIGGQIATSTWKSSWIEGTTEGGSSGSGLFTGDPSIGYQLRGGLFGGAASCANTGQSEAAGNVDYYSRLDQVYPSIQQYIGTPGGAVGPTRDYTGQWHNAAEGGRGFSLYQFGNTLFGLWFVYNAQGIGSWYQIENIWTANDVTSGRVVRWTGSPWAPTYNPNARVLIESGTYIISFTSATTANLTYNVDGVNRSISLTKITGG